MCEAFSCILTRKGDVIRHTNENVHSHASMIRLHNLKEKGNPERSNWISIECTPPNKQYSLPINKWIIKVDETTVPLWYTEDKDSYENIIRKATEQWKKKNCIRGCYCKVELHDNGKVSLERWYKNGLLYRTDGPACITYYQSGPVWEELWYRNDQRHRQDGPAWIFYNKDGSVKEERWLQNGLQHRLDGPAVICYYDNGKVREERWLQNGQRHRLDGPAYIFYNQLGSVRIERWYRNDKLHRLDGPADILYKQVGSVMVEQWYRNDQEINPLTTK